MTDNTALITRWGSRHHRGVLDSSRKPHSLARLRTDYHCFTEWFPEGLDICSGKKEEQALFVKETLIDVAII